MFDARYSIRTHVAGAITAGTIGETVTVAVNADDSIWGAGVDRSVELFRRLASDARKPWHGFAGLTPVQGEGGDELIRAANGDGLFAVGAEWEADSSKRDAFHAPAKRRKDREEAFRRTNAAGVGVTLFVVPGGRNEPLEDFEHAVDLADRLDGGVHPGPHTLCAGIELWAEYGPCLRRISDGIGSLE